MSAVDHIKDLRVGKKTVNGQLNPGQRCKIIEFCVHI